MSIHEGIDYYIDHYLKKKVAWIRDWREHRHSTLSNETCYEDLLRDTFTEFRRLVRFFGLQVSDAEVRDIVDAHTFKRVTGRWPDEEDVTSHQRKGIVGDWQNVFLPRHVKAFKRMAGDLLIELGYEDNADW